MESIISVLDILLIEDKNICINCANKTCRKNEVLASSNISTLGLKYWIVDYSIFNWLKQKKITFHKLYIVHLEKNTDKASETPSPWYSCLGGSSCNLVIL